MPEPRPTRQMSTEKKIFIVEITVGFPNRKAEETVREVVRTINSLFLGVEAKVKSGD